MYIIGDEEIEAIAQVIRSGRLFRYCEGSECDRFEQRYAQYLGIEHVTLTASGTNALTAAVMTLGIGPGDEVLVPAHTYMATALAVVSAGAIPVIVDIDESITIAPQAIEDAVGPRTKAVIPVHMWGAVCDMNAILQIAVKHDLYVIEDACQCVGGGYEGRKVGTLGHMGAFSFNYYKNMTGGEGGAVVTHDTALDQKAKCAIDPCHFYWTGHSEDVEPFCANSSRPSEIMGAMLNVQIDRLPGVIEAMRQEKQQILDGTKHLADQGLRPTPRNSPDHECATQIMYTLPSAEAAQRFTDIHPAVIAGKTGRHNYVEWDQIMAGRGAAHPQMNPFELEANRSCRRRYSKDMCASSLEILNRTIMIPTDPRHTQLETTQMIRNIESAAKATFGEISREEAEIRNAVEMDLKKYDVTQSS